MRMQRVLTFTAVLFECDESSPSLALAQPHPGAYWVVGWGLVSIDSAPPGYGFAYSAPWMDRSSRFLCTGPVPWHVSVSTLALDALPKAFPVLVLRDDLCFAQRRDVGLVFQCP